MQVMRQPRVDRSPALDPLFERCTASGAPQSLHIKPTQDSPEAVSSTFLLVMELIELVSIALLRPPDRACMTIVVVLDHLLDEVSLRPAVDRIRETLLPAEPREKPGIFVAAESRCWP